MNPNPGETIWTNTFGTDRDWQFIDKVFGYRGTLYLGQPLNTLDDLKPRPHTFRYQALSDRIERDRDAINATLELLRPHMYSGPITEVPEHTSVEDEPRWYNGYFSGMDARAGYAMVAAMRPARIIEIGVGHSTRFFRKAVREHATGTRLICIDPAPRANVSGVADEVVPKSVMDVDLSVFAQLEPGDILFWDGSHIVFNGADPVRLYLEILPILPPGVLVHIHDIALPFEAFANPEVGDVSYSEQYLLGTYLLNNKDATVLFPGQLLIREGTLPEWGGSFWFRT